MTWLISPSTTLLVPFFSVSSQRLQPFSAGSGVELTCRQDRPSRTYAVVERQCRDDDWMPVRGLLELFHAALAFALALHLHSLYWQP